MPRESKADKILRSRVTENFLLNHPVNGNHEEIMNILRKSISIDFVKKNHFLEYLDLRGISKKDAMVLIKTVKILDHELFWANRIKEDTQLWVDLFLETKGGPKITKQKFRNVLREYPICFEFGTPKQFKKVLPKLNSKELISTFYMSSCKKVYVYNRWYSDSWKRVPGCKEVKINEPLSTWLESELFKDILAGKSKSTDQVKRNLKFMKDNIL